MLFQVSATHTEAIDSCGFALTAVAMKKPSDHIQTRQKLKDIKAQNGVFDIDLLEQVLVKTIEEHGDFPLTIPAIKFISPTEKELRFTADDVRRMRNYIVG